MRFRHDSITHEARKRAKSFVLRAISLERAWPGRNNGHHAAPPKGAAQGEQTVKNMNNILIATAAVCTLFAAGAKAQCGAALTRKQPVLMQRLPAQALQ